MQTDRMRELITDVCASVRDTLLAKNRDYGGSAFESPILAPDIDAGAGIRVRASDKVARLHRLYAGNTAEVAESIEDTERDLIGYLVLQIVKRRLDAGGEGA